MRSRFFRSLWIIGNLMPLFVSGISGLVNSWWGFFPLSFLFLSFAAALFSWGALLASFFQKDAENNSAYVFLFSSFVAAAFAMITGHLGFLGEHFRWAYSVFLLLGLLLAPHYSLKNSFFLFQKNWLNLLFLFALGLRFFSAYLPQAHGDPLLYHLEAPRLWNLMGHVQLNHDLPVPLLAATWEYLYLWPQVIFASGAATVKELVLAQIFSQWIHLLWGWWGAALVLRELLRRRDVFSSLEKSIQEIWLAAALLAMLFVSSMQWTGALAKNDCGIGFWCLGAWLLLHDLKRKNWLFAGIFTGFAISGKINAILFVIPLVPVIYFWHGKKILGQIFSLTGAGLLGAILGAGPVYLRNWLETRDPFYTMFANWFPSEWISQSWADHFMAHQPTEESDRWYMLALRFHQLMRESPALWLGILAVLFIFWDEFRERCKKLWDWIALFILSVIVCIFAVSKDAEPRYLGASLWVGAVLGIYFLYLFSQRFSFRLQKIFVALCLVVLLARSGLPTHFLWKFFRSSPGEAYVLTHTAGKAKAWLRENLQHGELVVSYGDNESYYLSTLRATVLTERPDIDRATYGKKDFAEFLAGLCETSGARYLLDAREAGALSKRFPSDVWDQSIYFSADGARIYNLVKLQQLVLKKNAGCGRS